MAILQNPLIGRAKQKLGGTVFSTWKGKNVLRSKPLTVENPRTAKQLAQRNLLSALVTVFRNYAVFFTIGFRERAIGKSEYNAFVSVNSKNGYVTRSLTPPYTPVFDNSKLQVSSGTLGKLQSQSITADVSDDSIVVTWDGSVLPIGVASTDPVYVGLYNETTEELYVDNTNEFQDGGGNYTSSDLSFSAGDTINCYLFVYNNLGQASDSVFATAVATA